MIKKYYLLSPGPTPVPENVLAAAAEPIIHHRTPEFSGIFMEVSESLKYVFETKEVVFVLTSSGSGAMETAVINTLNPGDKVIIQPPVYYPIMSQILGTGRQIVENPLKIESLFLKLTALPLYPPSIIVVATIDGSCGSSLFRVIVLFFMTIFS